MKKTFKLIGMMLLAITMAGTFASCSNDEEPGDENHDARLIGKWTADYTLTLDEEDGYESEIDVTCKETYEFKKDFNFEEKFEATFPDGTKIKSNQKGVWRTTSGRLYVSYTESSDKDEIGDNDDWSYSFPSNNILNIGGLDYIKN